MLHKNLIQEVVMSQVIRIPDHLYKRLESIAVGFDSPASVIERVLDFYETNHHKNGKSSEDEVLRTRFESRFNEQSSVKSSSELIGLKGYTSVAKGRFSRDLRNETYTITSPEGISRTFRLPDLNDKRGIRELTHEVEEFVREQEGTIGQIKAARKKLTEFGYHITK